VILDLIVPGIILDLIVSGIILIASLFEGLIWALVFILILP
jgi:hypothetical protein